MSGNRPRHVVTETDELATALDAAARRWPGLTRTQLLTRLALEGDCAARGMDEQSRRHRLAAVRRHSGALTGVYESHYLARLRADWPA